ncbi:MAG: A24 family peptidase C-terminal domain-containing protein [Candidatus Woesearchaeota archaeon]
MLEYFLPIIILLGLITSYEDLFFGKIRNRDLMIAFFFGLIIYLYIILNQILYQEAYISITLIIYILINLFIALMLGFFLWIIKFWSPGDAKLYAIYAFILPPITLNPAFNWFYILFNSFIPFLTYGMIITIRENLSYKTLDEIHKKLNWKNIFETAINVFVITWLASELISLININNNIVSIMIVSGILYYIVRRFIIGIFFDLAKKNNEIIFWIIGIILSSLRIIIEGRTILNFGFIIHFMLYYIIIATLRNHITSETKTLYNKKVHILNLKQGMVISDIIIKNEDTYEIDEKEKIFSKINSEFGPELDNEKIKEMIKLYKKGKFKFNKLNVQKTIPFAPLMFAGIILTLIANGIIISII